MNGFFRWPNRRSGRASRASTGSPAAMACSDVRLLLRPLLDGELDEVRQRRVLDHLEGCSDCDRMRCDFASLIGALQSLEPEDAPPHFTPALQVRLASHRRRAASPRRLRWVTASAAILSVAAAFVLLAPRGLNAADVARSARMSWSQVHNYGAEFQSIGRYQGRSRIFRQRQFFRRPGEFRLDTRQDYPLSTFVYDDRVVQFLPGGSWKGRGPLVIVRPRREGETALPFPFGVTWQLGGNLRLDQIIEQFNENRDARLVGEDRIADRECFHVEFTSAPPGGSQQDRYELWLDKEHFLPRRVSWYRDADNYVQTDAQDLQVNYAVLPDGTFDFKPPAGSCILQGEVDPHAVALPLSPDSGFGPTDAAERAAWARRKSFAFKPVAPGWVPSGYEFLRVWRRGKRYLDMHWIREDRSGVFQVLKLVQQDLSVHSQRPVGLPVSLTSQRGRSDASLYERSEPFPHAVLEWVVGRTRCTLYAVGLSRPQLLRLARSVRQIRDPSRTLPPERSPLTGEFVLSEPAANQTASIEPDGGFVQAAASHTEEPPMMPDMPED